MTGNYVYEQGGVDVAAATEQVRQQSLTTVGIAAVRWLETQAARDLSLLRFAVCRFQTYDNLAREAHLTEGGAR